MEDSKEYFARREAEERAAAERATDPRARHSHLQLAEEFARAAQGSETMKVSADTVVSITPRDLRIIS